MRLIILPLALSLCPGVAFLAAPGAGPVFSQARGGAEAVTRCDVEAYVLDRDPRGMNVRSGPGSQHRVIGNLPNQEVEGINVHITGSQGEWVPHRPRDGGRRRAGADLI